ncbi:MAG: 23S rRNA (pseudouridine(1915)-N(3))-methyltransferase RlmH [Deltaproteobacteria bacterium]|nr:MAG: 23S rRNA (pseudouridine(1915)-N(3))-methyltransferase RlmH [Deltaproteobacteria bacterium]
MLKLRIIVVDRTRSSFLKEGESFYLERLRRYVQVEWVEVKPAKIRKGRPEQEILGTEGEAIARKVAPRDYLVPLDRTGEQFDSEALAAWLESLSNRRGGWVSFIIGGPLGLSKELLDRANKILSLSRLTLTHEMSRLLLLEQLYRAFTILRGEKYHK